ncbi:MAG TPA: biotin/lipoyl-containing protein, partial [Roseiarcus sp.]|nr:biotin/lipoyl-containing protein [Roseiarcus sp.]
QVEHPVTEMVTGVDLVEQMLRVAAGERLALKQSDVRLSGWAVETRVYAEDPTRNFLPSTGRLVRYRPPREGETLGATIRNDAGVYEGSEISIHYDPMIAKLVAHAPTRSGAIEAQAQALDSFVIEGIPHNVPFLSAIMQNERWRQGRLSTGFIAEEYPAGFHSAKATGETAHRLAAVAAFVDHTLNRRKRGISGQMRAPSHVSFERDRVAVLGEERYELQVVERGQEIDVVLAGGHTLRIDSSWTPGEPVWAGAVDGKRFFVQVRPILNGFALAHRGVAVNARVYTRREAELAAFMPAKKAPDASKSLLCPMPGLVRAISVVEGQDVKAGEALCMVEAMKMENVLRAERDVTVKKIVAKAGDSLAVDAVIMEFA